MELRKKPLPDFLKNRLLFQVFVIAQRKALPTKIDLSIFLLLGVESPKYDILLKNYKTCSLLSKSAQD